jgi:hypothetical protein
MAFSLLLLPGHNFQFVGAGSKEWISVGLALTSDVMCFLSCITTRMMIYGASPHVSLACGVREHLRATMDEGKSFILIVDRKQLWRMRARRELRRRLVRADAMVRGGFCDVALSQG